MWNQEILFARMQMGGIALAVLAVTLMLRKIMLRRLERATSSPFATVLRSDLGTPTLLWCFAISIDAIVGVAEFSPRVERLGHNIVVSFLILSLTMVASSVLMRSLQLYGERHNVPFAVAGLSQTLTRAVVFSIGLLILFGFLGISITPVLTALGVGGLAVALALQDTLANLFAGLHILIERPIAVGDYIRMTADEEGTVSDIGWRTTRLITGSNSTVVIPNKTITSGTLLNYSMPALEVGTSIPVLVSADADIAQVERIAVDAALATDGVLHEPAPMLIADPGMTLTHLQYKLTFRVPRQLTAGGVRTQVVNRMLAGFRKEGVPLPEPRIR